VEPTDTIAPPVVAVMVVHEPGAWFDDVLDSLARQDYTNLKYLFLVTADGAASPLGDDIVEIPEGPGGVAERIRGKVPNAFVRAISGNPGFGAAANEVVRLVEGDPPARRRAVPLECGHRRPETGDVGRAARVAAHRPRRRPVR
jgi:hypothetical protein